MIIINKMANITRLALLLVSIALAGAACRQAQREAPGKPADIKESLIKANKEVANTESDQIDDFMSRYGWKMTTTTTGLRYMIYEQGKGPGPKPGDVARLNYTLTLLNGDTVYTSRKDGPIIFEVGKGQVISGLEEAILLLKVGDRAKIIIPSHLAFGLIGDQNKIDFKASLVYDLEFVSLNNP